MFFIKRLCNIIVLANVGNFNDTSNKMHENLSISVHFDIKLILFSDIMELSSVYLILSTYFVAALSGATMPFTSNVKISVE